MRRRLIAGLVIAVTFVALISTPSMAADESAVEASVTVTEVISITLSDSAPAGIHFGSLAPGTTNNPDEDSDNTTPSITVNVGSETNVNIDLQINGTDFSGTFTVDNAKCSTTYAGTKNTLSTDYATISTSITPGGSQSLWHWLDVPAGTPAGSYTSTFSYKAITTP
jgi:hypothetical protein